MSVIVHSRITERHPEIQEKDVLVAWEHCIRSIPRLEKNSSEYAAVGVDGNGRLIEMIGVRLIDGLWLIYHAMTPPSKKILSELDFFD